MVKTTEQDLGEAYRRAKRFIMAMEPVSPRIMGALWREHFGLYHRHNLTMLGQINEMWIEFPDDRDYTAFVLRFA